MTKHPVASREEWLGARKRHLEHEKEMTRTRDRLAEGRRSDWIRRHDEYPAPRGPA